MIADVFPIVIVEGMLEQNIIANSNINDMEYLLTLWKEYAEPDLDLKCNMCKSRILENFRQIQPALILRVQEYKLLKNVD